MGHRMVLEWYLLVLDDISILTREGVINIA